MKWGNKRDQRETPKLKPLTKLEILNIIGEMGNSTSMAHDDLDNMMINHGAFALHGPITHLVNTSITQHKFASHWKIGKILPLHKGKGLDRESPTSYRPISLLPVLGKTTERAVQSQIMNFMRDTEQLNENHHSYREHHLTTTAIAAAQ